MHANSMSKEQLVSALATTWRNESTLMAQTIALLIAIEDKRVHLELACPSMFEFCMRHLGMSEGEAYRRTTVARVAGRFPAVLTALREKRVHLTTLAKVRKLFTTDNVDELLAAVAGKRKREVEEIIARYAPKPDVSSRIRKLPARRERRSEMQNEAPTLAQRESVGELVASSVSPGAAPAGSSPLTPAFVESLRETPRQATRETAPSASIPTASPSPRLTPASERTLDLFASPPRPATVMPLSESRYAVQFTADAELVAVIDEVKSLMGHRHPDGDLAAMAKVAFSDLAARLKKEKFAALSKKSARARAPAANGAKTNAIGGGLGEGPIPGSADRLKTETVDRSVAGHNERRHIRNAVKREVAARDGLQCTYLAANGDRCPATDRLELDHRHPRALGGGNDATNLRLLCRAHNQHAAEIAFGREHVAHAIGQRKRAPSQGSTEPQPTRAALGGGASKPPK